MSVLRCLNDLNDLMSVFRCLSDLNDLMSVFRWLNVLMIWFDVNLFKIAKIEIKQMATQKCNLCPMACWTTKIKSDASKTWAWTCPKLGPEKSENWWKTQKHYPNLWSPWVLKYEEITPRSLASLVEMTAREFTQWTPSVCPNMWDLQHCVAVSMTKTWENHGILGWSMSLYKPHADIPDSRQKQYDIGKDEWCHFKFQTTQQDQQTHVPCFYIQTISYYILKLDFGMANYITNKWMTIIKLQNER